MNSVFSEQILADKLSKLNSTQQCIETLSHWCIFHRSKAELVIATWDKQFHSSQMVQKVPFLYLANDILQNSKRNGNEFVSEFWKVLPAALKDLVENGDEHGKTVVSRLVDIWEERRVFGSRARSLKDVMLGKESPPPLEFGRKRSRSVKIVRRDARSIRTKLAIGGTAEKIVSAFHLVLSGHASEEAEMSTCKSAVHRVRRMEKDVDMACTTKVGDPKRTTLANELGEEEAILKQCIEKLKSVEATRVALVSQLREALQEQESEMEHVRTQLQVAEAQAEEACRMRKQLNGEEYVAVTNLSSATTIAKADANAGGEASKSAAAAIADKLAASSSSQLIMSSVLSTFAAEAAKNAGMTTSSSAPGSFTSTPTNSMMDLRPKLEKPMQVSDPNVYVASQPHAGLTHPYQTVLVPQPPTQGQILTSQSQYQLLPNQPSQQYLQPSGGIVGLSYGYNINGYGVNGYGGVPPLPPGPPPPPSHMVSSVAPLPQQQQSMLINQQQLQQSVQMNQHPPAPPSFRPLQPPGMVYYAPHNQSQ